MILPIMTYICQGTETLTLGGWFVKKYILKPYTYSNTEIQEKRLRESEYKNKQLNEF